MRSQLTYDEKIKAVTHYLVTSQQYSDTAKKFGIGATTVKKYVEAYSGDPRVATALQNKEKRFKGKMEAIELAHTAEVEILVNQIKESAQKVNIAAVARILTLIPDETNLDKVLSAYKISSDILKTDNEDAPDAKVVNNYYTQINEQLKKRQNA